MGWARFLIYPWFIFFCHVSELNQTSLGQTNDATYDPQGQQKSQITKLTQKKSLQNPYFKAIYHFSINSYLISAVVKSIP